MLVHCAMFQGEEIVSVIVRVRCVYRFPARPPYSITIPAVDRTTCSSALMSPLCRQTFRPACCARYFRPFPESVLCDHIVGWAACVSAISIITIMGISRTFALH